MVTRSSNGTRIRAVLLIFFLTFVGGAVPRGTLSHSLSYAAEEPSRAMWVWDVKIAGSQEASLRLVDFCISRRINLLYLSAFNFNENARKTYRSFNALAHKKGIKVHALAGDPRWCIEKYHKQPIKWARSVVEFNGESQPHERFDGIHSDAEPYVLGKVWEVEKQMLLKWYLDLNQKIADLIDIEEAGITFAADIPFWYDDDASMQVEWHGAVKPPSYHVLDTIDEITVMDYRNFAEGPNGSIALVKYEMEYAGKLGKKVYIGQETKKDVYPEYITFGMLTENLMESELKKLAGAYMGHPAFAGIAIHHYRSYKKLINKEKGTDAR